MAELVARTRALFARRPPAVRPRGPRPALRAAPHLARGLAHPRPHRGAWATTSSAAARTTGSRPRSRLAWRAWRWAARPRHEATAASAPPHPRTAAPASTTPSASCPRRSGGPSTRSTPSAAWWTTAWTSRAGKGEAGLRRWLEEVQPLLRREARRPSWAATWRRPSRAFPSRAPASRTSSRAAGWTSAIRRYPTFADLRVYCERVASAVGLASIEIFGYDEPAHPRATRWSSGWRCSSPTSCATSARTPRRGRLYIPLEELHRFRRRPRSEVLARPPSAGQRAAARCSSATRRSAPRQHYDQARAAAPARRTAGPCSRRR